MLFTFNTIQQAWDLKDPALIDYMVALAEQPNPEPEQPLPDDAPTFERFITYIMSDAFRALPYETKRSYRVEHIHYLETADLRYPLPERLKLHHLIVLLWSDETAYARQVLIEVIRRVPMIYGPWKAFKAIYKAAEAQHNYQIMGEIAARLDAQRFQWQRYQISAATKTYMLLRGWRYLRKLGQSLPACYPDAAVYYLAAYPEDTNWDGTWIAKHIFYHQHPDGYGLYHFGYIAASTSLIKHRAFNSLWQRDSAPLFRLLTSARAEKIRQFASDSLKSDFKITLRDIEPAVLNQLGSIPVSSSAIDTLLVWLLKNAPKFEQQQLRALGLHDMVLGLFDSSAKEAQLYACDYAKAYARDLAITRLLQLAENPLSEVRQLAIQLMSERDPRKETGLAVWGVLLESAYHHALASQVLRKHFGRSELTPDWFKQRLLAGTEYSLPFCEQYLFELHPLKSLGVAYFEEVLAALEPDWTKRPVANFLLAHLKKLDLATLSLEFVQTYLLHPLTQAELVTWIDNDDIKANILPIAYAQALAYEPDWERSAWVQALKESNLLWARDLHFNPELAESVRVWLADVRRFSPSSLGFDWLMQLVCREEAVYHDFAVERMIKAFVPADFAPPVVEAASASSSANPAVINIDLNGQSFLFTGKLNSMTREQAESMVTAANGKNSGAVNNKLDYLVIGDEGSPLYGNGRKGSKQVKAESLIAAGASLKIISETAFLQRLAGEQRSFSTDSVLAGCQTLWTMATSEAEAPVRQFALKYLRYHHPAICLKLTDRPVDPGAELPPEFLTFERFEPLFFHAQASSRQFALDFAEWELARWQPNSAQLLRLSEARHAEVRDFISKALLEQTDVSNKHYHLDAAQLAPAMVFGLCESRQAYSRQLGMQIIQQHACFQQPDALFQLSESPDRELRSMVVRIMWSRYRHYETTRHWRPSLPVMGTMGKAQQEQQQAQLKALGKGLPARPEQLPADALTLEQMLKRWLYELPPGRLGRDKPIPSLRPLSASAAKKALIETFRDLALEDVAFARLILPLLRNFTRSRGKMEQAACLVAVTRIECAYPELAGELV